MHTERLGHYEVELSARQFIHNGGWAAFAAIHGQQDEDDEHAARAAVFPEQRVADETVFASEAAAIAGAREAALVVLGDLGTVNPPR
ncbi:hypothetical protein LMG28688_00731 [Paraburkholderia caffeinitolerans]|uniref:Uncharacterized protein n=1 Tax=Paraburkholderia caffeinitolerans TaxID=1723730 RepID=A0A6J5FIA8_9BURK|nr:MULTISPECIES: hypothetical protein [Paraburkholderia]CAB3779121.1 hypothetical protein LMG28688_00731 [Paraburkholderia caffeinitolerans]